VTELIMNTLKYAFPDGSDGIVTVGLRAAEQEGVLRVTDTGIGFDPEIVRAAGFGLVLVRSLTSQINGSAALESRPGHNEWVIGFPLQWASIPDLPPAETVPIFPVCT
ncbi:MAG TPA: ATP-binding protein, partial [Spirochaetia bacterium]|nr:ATP-binding protein [Spirochaetia bacterium]